MTRIPDQTHYTITAAAKRMNRSRRTIERWVAGGMKHRLTSGLVIIDHDDLIAETIRRNRENPAKRSPTRTP